MKILCALLMSCASTAFAQTNITQEQFEAITSQKGFNRKCLHLSDTGRAIMHGLTATNNGHSTAGTGFSIEVCTPANWITRRMDEAKRRYIDLKWSDLKEEDTVDLLHVIALPDKTTNLNVDNGTGVATVVLRHPDKDKRRTIVLQPVSSRAFGVEQQNNLGGKAELEGIDATFPLSGLATVRDESGEFLVTVVGEHGEKNFKVKTKHLDDLGLGRTVLDAATAN